MHPMINRLSPRISLFGRYIISGWIAATVHFALLFFLVEWQSLNPTLASALGFTAAIFVNYSLQYYWTFSVSGPHRTFFLRYLSVTMLTLGINTLLFWTLNAVMEIHYTIAQVVATGVVVIVNFAINQRYTFSSGVVASRPH